MAAYLCQHICKHKTLKKEAEIHHLYVEMSNPGPQSFIVDDKREDFLKNGCQMQVVFATVNRKNDYMPPPFEEGFLSCMHMGWGCTFWFFLLFVFHWVTLV